MAFSGSNEDHVIDDVWQYSQAAAPSDFSTANLTAHLENKKQERLVEKPHKSRYSLSAGFSAIPSPVSMRQSGPSLLRRSLAPDTIASPISSSRGATTAGQQPSLLISSPAPRSADDSFAQGPGRAPSAPADDFSYLPDPPLFKSPRRALSFMNNTMLDATLGGSFAVGAGDLSQLDDASLSGVPKVFDAFEGHVRQQNVCADPMRMAKGFARSCQEALDLLEQAQAQPQVYLPPQRLQQLNQSGAQLREEKHMWLLAHALYGDRLQGVPDSEARVTDYVVNKLSEQDIAKALLERDSTVRESQMVVDWLESAAKEKLASIERVEFFSDTVCWENTQHEMKLCRESKQSLPGGLVTELDPDVAIRQKKSLVEDDVRDERRLLQQVFALIRAGQLQQAQDLCRKCGEAWRAADLEGWMLFHDPNVEGKSGNVVGNPFRDVWKLACWQSANVEGYNAFERAIIAAYSGNLEKLLPVCESWEDCLWAYFKTFVDVHVEEEIRLVPRQDSRPWEPLPEGYGEKSLSPSAIFDELEHSPNEKLRKQSSFALHVVEKHLILNDVQGLLNTYHEWLEVHPSLDHHLLRCMAHTLLFMRTMNQHLENTLCDEVIEAYIKALIDDKQHNLVATYTMCLSPALQVSVYAAFLEGVEEKEEKRTLLELGEKAGLDVARIAKMVVESIRCGGVDELQSDMQTAQTSLTESDERRIAALDWLVFEKAQRGEAVRQACALIRTFLATKKHVAARAVLDKIPTGSMQVIQDEWKAKAGSNILPADVENSLHELTGLEAYLLALNSFDDWFRHFHHNKPAMPARTAASFTEQVALEQENKQHKVELQRWEYALQACTQDAVQKIYAVVMFPGGWLQDVQESPHVDGSRQQQLLLLRRLCLPSLCFLLVKILKTTSHGRECMQVADVVASEEYQLYTLFQRSELQRFLQEIQQAPIDILRTGLEDPLGYEL